MNMSLLGKFEFSGDPIRQPERFILSRFVLTFILCVRGFFLHVIPYTMCVPGAHGGQKRASDSLEMSHDGFELPRWCW